MQSTFHTWMGQALLRQGKISEAALEYTAARNQISALRASGSDDLQKQISFCSATDGLAGSFLKLGEIEKAKKAYDQSLAILEPLQRANADDQEVLYGLADTYTGEAEVSMKRAQRSRERESKLANWQAAREWFQKSLSTWKKVSNPARISVNGIEVTPPSEIEQRLADCDRQLLLLNGSARMQ
jgi:tetratricopeptide (TPR) repeat protein